MQVKFVLQKKNIAFDEFSPVSNAVAPIYCPAIDACIFVTDISKLNPENSAVSSESLQKVLQTVFGMLVGDKKAIIIDIADFLAGTRIEDIIDGILEDQPEPNEDKTQQSTAHESA
jgi:hypothetical protein